MILAEQGIHKQEYDFIKCDGIKIRFKRELTSSGRLIQIHHHHSYGFEGEGISPIMAAIAQPQSTKELNGVYGSIPDCREILR